MRILSMKQIREVLRLHLLAQLSSRKIQGATGVARSTIQDYILRCKKANIISADVLIQLDDDTLHLKLFGEPTQKCQANCKTRQIKSKRCSTLKLKPTAIFL